MIRDGESRPGVYLDFYTAPELWLPYDFSVLIESIKTISRDYH